MENLKVILSKLNKKELLVGGLYALSFAYFSHWLILITIPFSAIFWALTGAGYNKLFRRLGCPLLIAGSLAMRFHTISSIAIGLTLFSIIATFGILSLGYGIPTFVKDRDDYDEGSWLGRLFYTYCHIYVDGKEILANFLTREFIQLLLGLAWIHLAWISFKGFESIILLLLGGMAAILFLEENYYH